MSFSAIACTLINRCVARSFGKGMVLTEAPTLGTRTEARISFGIDISLPLDCEIGNENRVEELKLK